MKVKKFLNMLNLASNCFIYVHDCDTGYIHRVFYDAVRKGEYGQLNELKVNSYTINEHGLTVYAER